MFHYDNKIEDIVYHFDPQKSLKISINVFTGTIRRDIPKFSTQQVKLEEVFQKFNADHNRMWMKWTEFSKIFTVNPENKDFHDYYEKNQYNFVYMKDFGRNIPEPHRQNIPSQINEPVKSEISEAVEENMPPVQPEIDLANLDKSIEIVYNKNLAENTKGAIRAQRGSGRVT